ncbi:MAG: hypothetical protein K2W99_08370 [Chthoniobacterales bacterium]|nr:hypothetical protein [Chthoniobacterales bacterium]
MKKEMIHPEIQDEETEARELEQILKDMAKSIVESCSKPGKSGLTFSQFKAQYLKNIANAVAPHHASH